MRLLTSLSRDTAIAADVRWYSKGTCDVKMGKDAFRCITALLLLCWSTGFLCAQENATRLSGADRQSRVQTQSSASTGDQDNAIQEVFPPLLFLPNEQGKPSVALAPTLKSEELNELLQRSRREDNPEYLINALRLDVVAERDFAVIQFQLDVRLLKTGLTAIPIRMGQTHVTRTPTARTSSDSATASDSPSVETPVGIRLRRPDLATQALSGDLAFAQAGGRDEWELIVRGDEEDQLTIEFESQVQVQRLGKESHLRLELPRVKSEMKIRVPLANAAGHVLTPGVISRAVPIAPTERTTERTTRSGAAADEGANLDADVEPEAQPKTKSKDQPNSDDKSESSQNSNTTDFVLTALPSNLDFVWYPQTDNPDDEQLSFEVQGVIDVEVDALEGLLSDATFTVTSFNRPIEAMIIRLPENTRPVETGMSDFGEYQIRMLDPDSNSGSSGPNKESSRREVSVTFNEPSLTPPEIRLRVQAAKELTEFELAGFEILVEDGDKRISATVAAGVVSVRSQGARRPKIQTGDFARRISGDSVSRGVETFEYSRPNQIRLLISRESTELDIEPTYVIELEESRATLTAIFQCSQRGGNLDSLVIDLGEWSYFDVLDPENVVDSENVRNDEELEIPLTNAPDNFNILVQARLQLPESLNAMPRELQLSFPVPREAQRILQAKVAVVGEDSIVAVGPSSTEYSEAESTNVLQTLAEVQAELFEDDLISNAPLCFLKRTPGEPSPLSLEVSKLPRMTDVDCEIELTDLEVLNDSSIRIGVRQTLRWQVRNVPLQFALLRMHEDIYQDINETANLAVFVDGKSRLGQNFRRIPAFLDAYSDSVSVSVRLDPRLGAFEMVLTYDWLHEDDDPQRISQRAVTLAELPLVLPRQQSRSNEFMANMRLRTPRIVGYDISLALSDEPVVSWLGPTDLAAPNPDFEAILDPDADQLPSTIPLEIRPAEITAAETKFKRPVDRAWFQTWLTDATRTDRAVFKLRSGGGSTVRIRLPQEKPEKLYAFVNGEQADVSWDDGVMELVLDSDDEQTTSGSSQPAANEPPVIELQYWSERREPPGLLTTDVPRIEGADILGQWYWHIVMPRNECMVTWSRTLTQAHQWDWSSIFPVRRPQRSLADLEAWSGAIITGDQVLSGSTEYLFGATGEATTLSIRTTLRPVFILSLAGTVFIFGVAMMYYRRRALLLVVVGVLIVGLIFLHPSYASIAGQVAVFGLLLVTLMTFLRWLTKQTAVRRAPMPSRDSAFDMSPVVKPGSSVVKDANAASGGSTTLAVGSSRVAQE